MAGRALFGFLYGERGFHKTLEIKLEPNERILFHDRLKTAGHKYPFEFAVSNQAMFFTREKHLAREAWYMKKVPLKEIKQVSLHRPLRASVIFISALIFLSGFSMYLLMLRNAMNHDPGSQTMPGPFYIMIAGLVLPFLTKNRKVLVIQTADRSFKWRPGSLTLDKESRNDITELQKNILNACQKAGIHVPRQQ